MQIFPLTSQTDNNISVLRPLHFDGNLRICLVIDKNKEIFLKELFLYTKFEEFVCDSEKWVAACITVQISKHTFTM